MGVMMYDVGLNGGLGLCLTFAITADQGDSGSAGRIARADVARVCVAALKSAAAKNVTLELFSKDGSQAVSEVDMIFNGLKPDNGPAK